MAGPAWLTASLASLMLLIAAFSAARLAIWRLRGRVTDPDIDALHLLMGVAMTGMLEPRLSPVPDAVWTGIFAVAAAWFTWRAVRARAPAQARDHTSAHRAPHAVECAAMIYMLLPARPAGRGPAMAMPGMGAPASNPAVALILALFMLGYILWTADQLATLSRARAAVALNRQPAAIPDQRASAGQASGPTAWSAIPGAAVLAPRLAACHKIVMSIAMGYMLITLL